MLPSSRKLIAIAIGTLLAGAPMVAFNYWFDEAIVRQGASDFDGFNRRTIHLAETRIGLVATTLAELARGGVHSCGPSEIDALKRANLTTAWVKEISILDADGETMCSDLGIALQPRSVITTQRTKDGDFTIEVVRIGETAERMVRIRRPVAGKNSLAAIISPDFLMAKLALNGGAIAGYASLVTSDGTLIDEVGDKPNGGGEHAVARMLQSDRLGLTVRLSMVRFSGTRFQDLQGLGAWVTGVFAVVIFGFAFLLPWRDSTNPVADLERALAAGEFVPYYQPIVDITTGRLRGAEVLMRWKKRDGTVLLPGSFIALAESSGLIIEMTRELMKKVSEEMGDAHSRHASLQIAFNLAARHFANERIVRDVRRIFEDSQVRLAQVVLELTERQPLENLTSARRVIAALQGLGIRVAIDDVGAGHSGLSYILKLGVDIIKIDKMFIDSLGSDVNSTTIVETLVDLARNMRMEIIAEGVENFEQVTALREHGIRAAQGYVFAPPLPGSSYLRLIEAIEPHPQPAQKPLEPFRYISTRRRAVA